VPPSVREISPEEARERLLERRVDRGAGDHPHAPGGQQWTKRRAGLVALILNAGALLGRAFGKRIDEHNGMAAAQHELIDGIERRRREVVHPVEATQHRRLAAAGRADERRDLLCRDVEIDVFDGTFAAQTWTGAFVDPRLPKGYSPFGIQELARTGPVAMRRTA